MGPLRTVEPSLTEPWVEGTYRESQDASELRASSWAVQVRDRVRALGQTQAGKPASPLTQLQGLTALHPL